MNEVMKKISRANLVGATVALTHGLWLIEKVVKKAKF